MPCVSAPAIASQPPVRRRTAKATTTAGQTSYFTAWQDGHASVGNNGRDSDGAVAQPNPTMPLRNIVWLLFGLALAAMPDAASFVAIINRKRMPALC